MTLPERRQAAGELRLLDQVAGHPTIQTYIALADQFTGLLGYTEHGSATTATWPSWPPWPATCTTSAT